MMNAPPGGPRPPGASAPNQPGAAPPPGAPPPGAPPGAMPGAPPAGPQPGAGRAAMKGTMLGAPPAPAALPTLGTLARGMPHRSGNPPLLFSPQSRGAQRPPRRRGIGAGQSSAAPWSQIRAEGMNRDMTASRQHSPQSLRRSSVASAGTLGLAASPAAFGAPKGRRAEPGGPLRSRRSVSVSQCTRRRRSPLGFSRWGRYGPGAAPIGRWRSCHGQKGAHCPVVTCASIVVTCSVLCFPIWRSCVVDWKSSGVHAGRRQQSIMFSAVLNMLSGAAGEVRKPTSARA